MGKRISKPITISLQPEVLKTLDDLVAKNDTNRSQYIANLIINETKPKQQTNKLKALLYSVMKNN